MRDAALDLEYARVLAPFVIETSFVVPGAFTKGTNHFAHAGEPADGARAAEYAQAWPPGLADGVREALAATVPENADPMEVARAVTAIVQSAHGTRPFRIVVDPASDGASVTYAVIDRVREQFLDRIGYASLRVPAG